MPGNVAGHLKFVELAAGNGADLTFFPELSLTGYEPRLAKALATDENDPRLDGIQRISDRKSIVIGAGLPLRGEGGVRIGMVWFAPNKPMRTYAKQELHEDEFPFFIPGNEQLILEIGDHKLVPAICYESLQPKHAQAAANLGGDIYLASVAKPTRAMARAVLHYPAIAREHSMSVIMANCVGPSDNFVSVGQSAAWSARGELLAQMDSESEGIVMLDTAAGRAAIIPV